MIPEAETRSGRPLVVARFAHGAFKNIALESIDGRMEIIGQRLFRRG